MLDRLVNGKHVDITPDKRDGALKGHFTGGGLPSGGAPYQQLVTDGQGVAKWEDKPFGYPVKEVGKTIISERTIDFLIYQEGVPGGTAVNMENAALTEGQTYIVTFGEKQYECVCRVLPYEPIDYLIIGNSNVLVNGYEDSYSKDEPFSIVTRADNSQEYHTVYSMQGGGIKVACYELNVGVKAIDPKYLPEGVGYSETGYVILAVPHNPKTGEELPSVINFTEEPEVTETGVYKYYTGTGYLLNGDDDQLVAVYFDGVPYVVQYTSGQYWMMGNASLYDTSPGEDTGEPFFLHQFNTGNGSMELYAKTDGPHTVEIKLYGENVKRIDSKFLPEDYAYLLLGVEEMEEGTVGTIKAEVWVDGNGKKRLGLWLEPDSAS